MFSNLLKHTLRSFKRQRAYVIINIIGLSVGIACSLLIAVFVINEASFDGYNVKKERIFRLILDGKIGGQEVVGAYTSAPMGPVMAKEFPEVERLTKFIPAIRITKTAISENIYMAVTALLLTSYPNWACK